MTGLRSSVVDLAKAPASGAGPGVESPRLDYRKSAMHLHPYVSALSDGHDRFRVRSVILAASANLDQHSPGCASR